MFKRTRRAEDFADEIKAHLELEVDQLKGEGLSEEEARRKAAVEFGNVHTAQERFSLRNRVVWLDDLVRDVKFALRQLWKAPGFTVTAVYAVGRRVHEIGLRMALGASRASVFRMIYRQSITIIAAGLAFGVALALLVARAVGSMVMVSVWDPATYVFVAMVLALAALASCYLPARRAMAVEPMVALRED